MASSNLPDIVEILGFEVFDEEHDGVNHGFSVKLSNGDLDDVQANDPRLPRELFGEFLTSSVKKDWKSWANKVPTEYKLSPNRVKDECIKKVLQWFDEEQGSVSSFKEGGQGCVSLPDTTGIPVLLEETIGDKKIWMPFIAFVSQNVNLDQTRDIALALYTEVGFETDGTDFVYYGHPIANWQCSVCNGNIACVTNNQTDEAERAHVVFPHQIRKVVSTSPTCIVEVQGGNQIPVDASFINVPGFFHIDGDRDKPYLFTDLTGRTSYQEEYPRLRNLWEECANSQANHGHAPGSNKPGLIDTAVNTDGSPTQNPPFVKLTKQEVETLEMLFEQQEPPAPAAKPIASPEPHLHATITDIEAHKGHCHNFTVRYQLQDQPNVNGNAIVTSTDGNFHLPLTGGYVWDSNSHDKFRRFWETQNPIDLTLNSPDPENTALPNSRTLLKIQRAGNVTLDGKIQIVLYFTYSNRPIDEPPTSTIVLMSSGNLSDMEDAEVATCPWTKESHDMFREEWEKLQDKATPTDGQDSPYNAPSHCNSTPVPFTNSQSMDATNGDEFVDDLLGGPGHLVGGKRPDSPSCSPTPLTMDFDKSPEVHLAENLSRDRSYEPHGNQSPPGRRTPYDDLDDFANQSEPNSPRPHHPSATRPGIHKVENKLVPTPHGSPKTPPSQPEHLVDNVQKAAEGGNPKARKTLNDIAHAIGRSPIFSASGFHNAAEMKAAREATNPVQPEDMALDDMSDEELERTFAKVEEKKAQLQRSLDKVGRHTERLKKAIRKREQRKKFDAQKKFKKSIHEALEREHSNKITDMKKRYEKRQQKLAATKIQALLRGASDRQLCQQLARKAALMRLANEKRQEADKAEREAKRLRQEADEALSELNELTNV